jgi:hypothetical protein
MRHIAQTKSFYPNNSSRYLVIYDRNIYSPTPRPWTNSFVLKRKIRTHALSIAAPQVTIRHSSTACKFVMVLGEKRVSVAGSQVIFFEIDRVKADLGILEFRPPVWRRNGNEVRDKPKLNVRFTLPTVTKYLHIFMRLVDATV